jgi:hypothetical protein
MYPSQPSVLKKNQRTILDPYTMVLRKSKNWSKTLPGIISSFLILFKKTWWFFEICQKPNKMGSYFILYKTPNLGLFKILGPDIATINRYGTSWGLFYFLVSLKTYREYLTHEKHNVQKKEASVLTRHFGHLEMMSPSHDFLLSAEQFKFHTYGRTAHHRTLL